LLNTFWQTTSFWKANAASSAPFALIHIPGWFALDRFATTSQVAVDALGIFVFGLVFGWAMKKTGSLWPAYGLHALNNLLVIAVLGA
jgi:membrane protease YdiL (CAAX protease family)